MKDPAAHPSGQDASRAPANATTRLLVTLFAWIVATYPPRFRRQLAGEMERSFESRLTATRRRSGRLATLRTAARELVFAVAGSVSERFGRPPRSAGDPRHPRRRERYWSATLHDVTQAVRGFVRNPGFTATAVLTLAIGIGLNTAIFSVIQAVLLRPLPYSEPDRLVAPQIGFQGQSWWSGSLADVLEWRELNQSLESVSFALITNLALAGDGLPEQVPGARVSADWFDTLGAGTHLGRTFVAGEDAEGADPVAVLTHGYWTRSLGGDPNVLGSTLRIDGEETTVVGVLQAEYGADFLGDPDLYVTRRYTLADAEDRARIYRTVARLRPNTTLEQAHDDLARVATIVAERDPGNMAGWTVWPRPLHEAVAGAQRDLLWSLLGAVSLVLLVACANVSNLLLARATRQRRELAVRTALGAGRARLVQQLLTETALLAGVGGLAGLTLAAWGTPALLALAPSTIPRIDQAGVDSTVLAFTLGLSLLAALGFGLLPALRSSGSSPAAMLRGQSGRIESGSSHRRLRAALVSAQLALVVMLLIGAGLMLQSFRTLQRGDLGFTTAGKLVVSMTLPTDFDYSESAAIATFYQEMADRVQALPGVVAVGDVTRAPLSSPAGSTAYHVIEGRDYEAGGEPTGGIEVVGTGYFEAMGMERVAGRLFNSLDRPETAPVAVVNDAMARLYWPDGSPVGERVAMARQGPEFWSGFREVVGVVSGVRYSPGNEIRPRLYVLDSQAPPPIADREVVVRTTLADPTALVPAIRSAVADIDPEQPIGMARAYDDILDGALSSTRLQTLLLGLFGLVSLGLGALGVYGVVSYSVSQRTREMGIRMALGARRSDVVSLVLRGAMAPVLVGVVAGSAGAMVLSRALAAFLHGISATDPTTYSVVLVLLSTVALLASLMPARRATNTDPVGSLRAD